MITQATFLLALALPYIAAQLACNSKDHCENGSVCFEKKCHSFTCSASNLRFAPAENNKVYIVQIKIDQKWYSTQRTYADFPTAAQMCTDMGLHTVDPYYMVTKAEVNDDGCVDVRQLECVGPSQGYIQLRVSCDYSLSVVCNPGVVNGISLDSGSLDRDCGKLQILYGNKWFDICFRDKGQGINISAIANSVCRKRGLQRAIVSKQANAEKRKTLLWTYQNVQSEYCSFVVLVTCVSDVNGTAVPSASCKDLPPQNSATSGFDKGKSVRNISSQPKDKENLFKRTDTHRDCNNRTTAVTVTAVIVVVALVIALIYSSRKIVLLKRENVRLKGDVSQNITTDTHFYSDIDTNDYIPDPCKHPQTENMDVSVKPGTSKATIMETEHYLEICVDTSTAKMKIDNEKSEKFQTPEEGQYIGLADAIRHEDVHNYADFGDNTIYAEPMKTKKETPCEKSEASMYQPLLRSQMNASHYASADTEK